MTLAKPMIVLVVVILTLTGGGSFLVKAQDANDEVEFFIESTSDTQLLAGFIKTYPSSLNLKIARDRLDELSNRSPLPAPRMTKTFRVTPETMH